MKAIIDKDKNGNKVVRIKPINGRSFSIQTNGSMPALQRLPIGEAWKGDSCPERWGEIRAYIENYGTIQQKQFFEDDDSARPVWLDDPTNYK